MRIFALEEVLKLCEVSVTLQNRHQTYAGTRRNPRRSVNPRHEPRHTRDTAADSRDTAADSLNTLPCKGSQRVSLSVSRVATGFRLGASHNR